MTKEPQRKIPTMQYRRSNIGGGTYFFTVNLAERSRCWLVEHIDVLRESVRIV